MANASCCKTFLDASNLASTPLLATSLANPSVSPIRAKALAFSLLISPPVSNSASNSFAIEDSKSNMLLPMLAIPSMVVPNFLASMAAAVKLLPCPVIRSLVALLVPAISFITAWYFILVLFRAFDIATCPINCCVSCFRFVPVASE